MYDIVIIGAGVTGSLIARELSRYRISVCILEKCSDVAMGSSSANSGIIHAGFDTEENTLKAVLNVKGSNMMSKISSELGVKFYNNGSLVIGFNNEDRHTLEDLYKRGIYNKVKGLEIIDGAKLKELEPQITDKALFALYAKSGGIICPYELNIAACGNAMDNGVNLKLNFNVKSIKIKDNHFIISSENETVDTDFIINAAGLFADEIANLIGDFSFKIKPRKGEYLLLNKECGKLFSRTIFRVPTKMGKGILISPTVDGNLLLGPTSTDIGDKNDTSTTAEGLNAVMAETLQNSSKIPFKNVITSFAGLRAHSDRGDFIIGSSKVNYKFINVAGIESPGLTASPAIDEYVAIIVKNTGLKMDLKNDFNPYREAGSFYQNLSKEEKNKIIKQNKRYGKIVCRCEGISEGEVVKAIHANPKALTLDAVKRRTRCQMGQCQGGFCSTRLVEILSEELNIPYEKVTKCGGNSFINYGKTK